MGVLVAVRTSMKLGLLKNLPEDRFISADQLGSAAGVSPGLIERMFRVLVAVGFIEQKGVEGYKHSHFSKDYVDPSKPSCAALFQGMYDEYFKNAVRMDEYLTTKFEAPIPEPSSIFDNCYNWGMNKEGQSIWDTMSANHERMAVFVNAFAGLDVIVPPTGSYFDFNQLATNERDPPERVEVVDVGGGNGRVLSDILKASPKLDPKKCVLQDLEKILVHAHGVSDMGVKTQVIDFYKEQPVKGIGVQAYSYGSHMLTPTQGPKPITCVILCTTMQTLQRLRYSRSLQAPWYRTVGF